MTDVRREITVDLSSTFPGLEIIRQNRTANKPSGVLLPVVFHSVTFEFTVEWVRHINQFQLLLYSLQDQIFSLMQININR